MKKQANDALYDLLNTLKSNRNVEIISIKGVTLYQTTEPRQMIIIQLIAEVIHLFTGRISK